MGMKKRMIMRYYNKLRELNPEAAKTKWGRSLLMNESIFTQQYLFNILVPFIINNSKK